MPSELQSLYVELTARTASFNAEMDKAIAKGGEAEGMLGGVGHAAALMSVAFVGASAAAAVWAVDGAAKLDQQLTQVRTQAGDTTDSLDSMRNTLISMAGQVGQAPDALAQAMYHAASAGYTGAAAYDIVQQSAKLAAIGQADLVDTTNAVVAVMKNGVVGVNNATDAVSQLNAIVGTGNMTLQDFVSAMGSGVLAEASGFGVSLQSLGAAMAYMTDRGVPADLAATRLRMSIALMGAPTKQAAKLLTDAGLSAKDAADETSAMQEAFVKAGVTTVQLSNDMRQPDGLMVALQDLKNHMDAAGVSANEQAAVLTRAFGGGRSGSAIMMLYNNLDAVGQKFAQIGQGASQFGADWAQQQDTLTQKEHDFSAALQGTRDKLGELMTPETKSGFDWLSHTALPAINTAIDWLGTTGVRDAQEAFAWLGPNILDPAEKMAGTLGNMGEDAVKLGVAIAPVAGAMGGPLLTTFHFLADNGPVLEGIVTVWATRWAEIKAIGIASEVVQWATAFRTFSSEEGALTAMGSALGMGGTTGLSGAIRGLGSDLQAFGAVAVTEADAATSLGTTLTVMGDDASIAEIKTAALGDSAGGATPKIAAAGVAAEEAGGASGFAALGAGLLGVVPLLAGLVVMNWDGISGGITKIQGAINGPDWASADQKLQDMTASYQQFSDSVTQGAPDVIKSIQDQQKYLNGGDWTSAIFSMAGSGAHSLLQNSSDQLSNALGQYQALDQTGKAVWADLYKANQSAANAFAVAWATNGHDSVDALQAVQDQFPQISDAVGTMADYVKRKQDDMWLDNEKAAEKSKQDAVTQANQQLQAVENAYGLQGQAAMDMYRKLNPEGAAMLDQQQRIAQAFGTTTQGIQQMQSAGLIAANGISLAYGNLGGTFNYDAYEIQLINQAIQDAQMNSAAFQQSLQTYGGGQGGTRHSASGGPMAAGEVSVVNEHGMEMWKGADGQQYMIAPSDGQIIPSVNVSGGGPSGGVGSGGDLVLSGNNFTFNGVQDMAAFERELRAYVLRRSKSSGRQHVYGALA